MQESASQQEGYDYGDPRYIVLQVSRLRNIVGFKFYGFRSFARCTLKIRDIRGKMIYMSDSGHVTRKIRERRRELSLKRPVTRKHAGTL